MVRYMHLLARPSFTLTQSTVGIINLRGPLRGSLWLSTQQRPHNNATTTVREPNRMSVAILYVAPPQNVHTTWDLDLGAFGLRPHMGPT